MKRRAVLATSSPTSGSMPPSFAIVSLLGALSVAKAHMADAASSFASGGPSLTSVHRGATAPVLAMAAWVRVRVRVRVRQLPS